MPNLSVEGAAIIAGALTISLPLSTWIYFMLKARLAKKSGVDLDGGWSSIDRKLGGALNRLDRLEQLPAKVDKALEMLGKEDGDHRVLLSVVSEMKERLGRIEGKL